MAPKSAIVFLLVAGALLMLLEPVFPLFVAGGVGLACWAGAVALTYTRYGVLAGHWTLAAALAIAIAGVWWYLRRLPGTRIARLVGSDRVTPPETAATAHLLNRPGVALTPLRPGGMAEISGERVDVVTSGEPVERGQAITVVHIEGARILVRAVS
ncbi:MAG: hypothetical protein KIT22_08310 [Verrucomicrobiae bacterium]|nr:hypothetical protein [Verrucomicrobiae bacterium]